MPTPPITIDELAKRYQLVQEHGLEAAAEILDKHPRTIKDNVTDYESRMASADLSAAEFTLPQFPPDDISVEELINQQVRRFEKKKASFQAHTWFPVTWQSDKPVGLLWFGDPHLDDNGCNWPALKEHVDIAANTPGIYGVNIGDTTNNWTGRLLKKYADQDTSTKTARKFAEWFMVDSGVRWLLWLIGNHDAWNDGAEILARMAAKYNTRKLIMHDWEARFSMVFPNGWKPRVFCAHDFKGNSQWNPLHGPMKEGQMGADANLFVCGHKHNWATFTFENAKREMHQTFVRVKGYKEFDEYARRGGFAQQRDGCSILTVFIPAKKRIIPFEDVEAGAAFLTQERVSHEARIQSS